METSILSSICPSIISTLPYSFLEQRDLKNFYTLFFLLTVCAHSKKSLIYVYPLKFE